MKRHTITLNFGAYGRDKVDPDKPYAAIDGVPIDGLVSLKFSAGPGEFSTVDIRLEARIDGEVEVFSETLTRTIYPSKMMIDLTNIKGEVIQRVEVKP